MVVFGGVGSGLFSASEGGVLAYAVSSSPAGIRNFYDVSPDDQPFLLAGGAPPEAAKAPITVVTNWFADLRK